MTKVLVVLAALACAAMLTPALAQDSAGKGFGSHAVRTCPSRKAGLSAAQAKQYFICDAEYTEATDANHGSIHLVSDVTVEVAKPRPFDMQTDTFGFAQTNAIDPTEKVYPIRGSFTQWRCEKLGNINGDPGKNCTKTPQPQAKGLCFKSSFGDWHCTMADLNGTTDMQRYPPPAGP